MSVPSTEGDDQALQSAALEKLPTFDRLRTAVLRLDGDDGKERTKIVDVTTLSVEDRHNIIERILRVTDENNERFLRKLRGRLDRVGIDLPKIEVRYHHLNVEAKVYEGTRATPSLINFYRSIIELPWRMLGFTNKLQVTILSDASGILKPKRLTLLLGPPESGRSTLLRALAGRLSKDLQVSGEITYNGHHMSEFVPQRTSAYISQYDLQTAELTVRENLDFYSRVQGVGNRYDMLIELTRREREAKIPLETDDVDIYLKATAATAESNLVADYIMKLMGLDICADTKMGDAMRRGISGGQKKRVTTAEMLVGPAKVFFMDEMSTGLDSSTTFQITQLLQQIVHVMDNTIVVSLLQPTPETYGLFDDLILLADGKIVYQGPCSHVLEFMASMGFKRPHRKATADFLQEVTSRKDQRQYWADKSAHYEFVTVSQFKDGFKRFHVGQSLAKELAIPYDKSQSHPAALVHEEYALSRRELLKACFAREVILMKRHLQMYIAKLLQIPIIAFISATLFLRTTLHHNTVDNANVYMGAIFFCLIFIMTAGLAELNFTVFRLPVYFKEKELFLYPAWALSVPMMLLRIPWTILEVGAYLAIVYFVTGFSPEPGRFFRLFLVLILINQATIAIFRFAAAVGRTRVAAEYVSIFLFVTTVTLGGFVLSIDSIPKWWRWAKWYSILLYGQEAVSVNEFLSKSWNKPFENSTLGVVALRTRGLSSRSYWVWTSIAALVGFSIVFNILFTLSLQYLDMPLMVRSTSVRSNETSSGEVVVQASRLSNFQSNFPISPRQTSAEDDKASELDQPRLSMQYDGVATLSDSNDVKIPDGSKGMVLPFMPLSISFDKIKYYIDMPDTMKEKGVTGERQRLQLLNNVSGAFRPGVLTALVGISGAGKTTLMDVLAGRKTRGYVEGEVFINGYPKMFVKEVMSLVELDVLRDNVVGLPGQFGLSTEQRKRLTIAVELVANPSIIFMDEPTSGLDARSAAIVMRAVRNIGDTGRTVVCTIHQPSIDIFEAFDELFLLKHGGETIYGGPLGGYSRHLIEYFEAIPGVPKIKEGYNPATWMLEVSSENMETTLGVNFAELYAKSAAFQINADIVKELRVPTAGSKDLEFPTVYAQSFRVQFLANFWKLGMSYWRHTTYTAMRFLLVIGMGLLLGSVFWGLGKKRETQVDVFNLMGTVYIPVVYLGYNYCLSSQSVIVIERIVYYRERGAGMYSPLSYAIAQVMIECPYVFVGSVLFTGVVYPLVQLEWQYDKVLWFLFFVFFNLLFFDLFGMVTVSATPNAQMAVILATSLFSILNLFSGLTITRKQMPVWWRWLYWGNPVAWSLYGLVTSQLGDVETFIAIADNPGQQITVKEYIRSYYGFDPGFLKYVAIEQVMLSVTLALLFALFIKYFNFQKR